MCYQCFGCGKCAGVVPDPDKNLCPLCHRNVEMGLRWCPYCGAYIRPKTGSLASKRKNARGTTAESSSDSQVVASAETVTPKVKPPVPIKPSSLA
ncbi:MAG: hypothetical protein IJJ32_03930 [Eggerthellaceae bacterium]|nr:hypothetical protein [Eggerthellaceae bacterium]